MEKAGIYVSAVVCAFSCALVSLIAYASQGVKPNSTVGYRNRYTMADPEVWVEINRRSGRMIVLWGIVFAVLSLLPLLYPSHVVLLTVVIGSVVPLIWITVYYHFESKRAYFLRHPEEAPPSAGRPDSGGRDGEG